MAPGVTSLNARLLFPVAAAVKTHFVGSATNIPLAEITDCPASLLFAPK